ATIAYVRPEAADRYVGMSATEGKKFLVNSIAIRERHLVRKHIIDEGERGNWKPLYDARGQGLLDAEEARQLRHDVLLGPLAARVNHFKYSDFIKVYEVATPEEKKQLDPIRLRKRADLLKKGKR